MDGFELVSSLFGNARWPAVVVLAMILFHKPLSTLPKSISNFVLKLKGFGVEVEIQGSVQKAVDLVDPAAINAAISDRPQIAGHSALRGDAALTFDTTPYITESAERDAVIAQNPAVIIWKSWFRLEFALKLAVYPDPPEFGRLRHRIHIDQCLEEPRLKTLLSSDDIQAIRELQKVKLQVENIENANVSPLEAVKYTLVVDALIDKLNKPNLEDS